MPCLTQIFQRLQQSYTPLPTAPCTLFLSVSDGKSRARVVHASGPGLEACWTQLLANYEAQAGVGAQLPKWLRIEWVTGREQLTWSEWQQLLHTTKRNYFRHGVAFDGAFKVALLEQELNANAILYGGTAISSATFNTKNFQTYVRRRYGRQVETSSLEHVWIFTTAGLFIDEAGECFEQTATGLETGHRTLEELSVAEVEKLVDSASGFLARQVNADGRFVYGYFPCFGREIGAYNALRHASTTYSMLEAWECNRDPLLWQSIVRALDYLTTTLIASVTVSSGEQAAFLVDEGGEVKLGGNAVSILALVKYTELSGDQQYRPLLDALGQGILEMRCAENPQRFHHVLSFPELSVKETFRIIYYDGEAAFGLMRLYALTGAQRWLQTVEQMFEHFIEHKHWQAHDHWLSYSVNELTRYRSSARYYMFGLANVNGYLDFVLERITTFPTLLELMMAAEAMVMRLAQDSEHSALLQHLDLDKFYRALEQRARYLLNGFFWPEMAMYFAKPEQIVGSFFIRHQAFRVRIDDVEHYLSGLVAYRRYLLREQQEPKVQGLIAAAQQKQRQLAYRGGANWNPERLLAATAGRWVTPPTNKWLATGLCIWAPSMLPGQMVVLRQAHGASGLSPIALKQLPFTPQALITEGPGALSGGHIPVLQVHNINDAILGMGRYARQQMLGRLIGVTGSAGKTSTVAMLTQALQPWGEVGHTRHNANLPHGIAWNLASIPWGVPHTVLEMAIGSMAANSRLVQPDVALVTNIGPAHLEYHQTTAMVAAKKSRIFGGMRKQGAAVLNRDMEHWDLVVAHARAQGLRIINYGSDSGCDVQLVSYASATQEVTIRIGSAHYTYRLGAPGKHMAVNSTACVAVALALGLPVEPMLSQFSLFEPLAGRGAVTDVSVGEGRLRIMDEAYNANPLSMQAALDLLGDSSLVALKLQRKVAVLGDMLELGEEARELHVQLANAVLQAAPDLLLLCGEHMRALAAALDDRINMHWYPSVTELNAAIRTQVQAGDLVLVKGSGASGLSGTVDLLRQVG